MEIQPYKFSSIDTHKNHFGFVSEMIRIPFICRKIELCRNEFC